MKESLKTAAGIILKFRPYIITALAVAASYILFVLILSVQGSIIRLLMLICVFLCFLLFLLKGRFKIRNLKAQHLIIAVIAAGIIMRIGYMLYTPFLERGHDVYNWDSTGHFGYMYQLFKSGALPQANSNQFYHPPFQHIIQALVVKLFSLFNQNGEIAGLFEAAKIVPCFASCAVMFVSRSICSEAGLSKRAAAIALSLVAFHPSFYILSSSVNNDSLMLLFFMTAVLYTIRWYKSPTMKNILLIALSIGFSMMTKLSGGMVALFTAPVFLAVLIQRIRLKQAKPLIGQFAAFALVCLPLALWYPIRNYILFNQPLGYVLRISSDSGLYCGARTITERFFSFPVNEIVNPLYCQPYGDYNIWLYTLKCSAFGEFQFEQAPFLAAALIVSNLAVILMSLAATVYTIARGKEVGRVVRFGMFYIWLVVMVSFIVFNLQYPFGCTMDFRYIIPTSIIGAIYTGIALNKIREKKKVLYSGIYYAGCALICLFCIASVLFYTV